MDPREAELFLGLPKGAFDHIPICARKPALETIAKVRVPEQEKDISPRTLLHTSGRPSGSTIASEKLGAETSRIRVEWFVTACVEALGKVTLRNYIPGHPA